MFQLDLKSRKSIYEQVVDNMKELIISGVIKPEDKLPSVRELSKSLTINPNTVQKAYRALEHQDYLYTVAGLGTFASCPTTDVRDEKLIGVIRDRIRGELKELFYLGLSKEEVTLILQKLMAERGGWK